MQHLILRPLAIAALLSLFGAQAFAQMPGSTGQMGRPSGPGPIVPDDSGGAPVADEKPDAAAKKAFKQAMKSFTKAQELDAASVNGRDPDKKAKAMDFYSRAVDQFTEALSNRGEMVEAWDYVGYSHLKLGAYAEAIDDYNHVLALRPELQEAIEHRAEAYLAVDRLEDAKAAYMELIVHSPTLAGQLMQSMQKWQSDHRSDPGRMRPADIAAFDKWLLERDGGAKPTASLPH